MDPKDMEINRLRNINTGLLAALEAVRARINGEWDHPALVAFGALGNCEADLLAIIAPAIAEAKGE